MQDKRAAKFEEIKNARSAAYNAAMLPMTDAERVDYIYDRALGALHAEGRGTARCDVSYRIKCILSICKVDHLFAEGLAAFDRIETEGRSRRLN